MAKTLKQVRAGRLVCAVVYTTPTAGDSSRARAEKQHASCEAREKLNARTSFEKLERVLAANFDTGDLYVTFTYDDRHLPDGRTAAIRRMQAFVPKLRRERRARGDPLSYVYVTEGAYPGGRLHHHMVLNSTGRDLELLRALWKYGDNVEIRRLRFDENYSYGDLASYLTKEPREWGNPRVGERTWTPSVGLNRPIPETVSGMPDNLTLTAPPEAVSVEVCRTESNGFGSYSWIKYLLPPDTNKRRKRAKKRKRKQTKE